jgi:hypothetical protein
MKTFSPVRKFHVFRHTLHAFALQTSKSLLSDSSTTSFAKPVAAITFGAHKLMCRARWHSFATP